MPRSLVYPTLLSALRLQGFTAIEGDGVVKILPEADAKQQGGAIATGPIGAGGDRLVTQVIILKYESAAQLVNVLRPLITPNNTIAAYPNGNALVITDYADNLKRLDLLYAGTTYIHCNYLPPDTPFSPTDTPSTLQNRAGTFSSHQTTVPNPSTTITLAAQGRYVRVQLTGTNYLSLAEVQVFGQ